LPIPMEGPLPGTVRIAHGGMNRNSPCTGSPVFLVPSVAARVILVPLVLFVVVIGIPVLLVSFVEIRVILVPLVLFVVVIGIPVFLVSFVGMRVILVPLVLFVAVIGIPIFLVSFVEIRVIPVPLVFFVAVIVIPVLLVSFVEVKVIPVHLVSFVVVGVIPVVPPLPLVIMIIRRAACHRQNRHREERRGENDHLAFQCLHRPFTSLSNIRVDCLGPQKIHRPELVVGQFQFLPEKGRFTRVGGEFQFMAEDQGLRSS
jgi:hypothetical protein